MANEENSSSVSSKRSTTIEIRPARSMTCYICLENIVTTHKQFGLQNNCDHFFCFDCLSTWRRTGAIMDKDAGGRCPLCRIRSTFIAPSWRCFNNTDDKQSLLDAHKLRLKRIPCQTLSQYGYCRFGHRCYYNHNIRYSSPLDEDDDGQQQEPPRRITYNSQRYRPY